MSNDKPTFTPIFDSVVGECSVIAAAIFGRMWRYAQMQGGVCRASFRTIASDLGLSRRAVIKHAMNLKARGYLVDRTPDKNRAVHSYEVVLRPSGERNAPDEIDLVHFVHQASEQNALDSTQTSAFRSPKDTYRDSFKILSPPVPAAGAGDHSSLDDKTPSLNQVRAEIQFSLAMHFADVTKLPRPKTATPAQARSAGQRWFGPLREIAELVDWNENRARQLITSSVERLIERDLSISAPASILRTAQMLYAEEARNRPKSRPQRVELVPDLSFEEDVLAEAIPPGGTIESRRIAHGE